MSDGNTVRNNYKSITDSKRRRSNETIFNSAPAPAEGLPEEIYKLTDFFYHVTPGADEPQLSEYLPI